MNGNTLSSCDEIIKMGLKSIFAFPVILFQYQPVLLTSTIKS